MKAATAYAVKHGLLGAIITVFAAPLFAATCNVSTTGVSLGSYTPNQAAALDSVGTVVIECAKDALDALPTTVNYGLEMGRGAGSSFAPREMKSGANKLNYNLYRDASRISVWGDATGGTTSVNATLRLQAPLGTASASHSVYARIFGGQNAVPGAYSDALLVTVVY